MKMKIEVDGNELAVMLDGLSALPLQRSYNLFNRIMQQGLAEGLVQPPPVPSAPLVATPEGDKGPIVGEATEVKAPIQ